MQWSLYGDYLFIAGAAVKSIRHNHSSDGFVMSAPRHLPFAASSLVCVLLASCGGSGTGTMDHPTPVLPSGILALAAASDSVAQPATGVTITVNPSGGSNGNMRPFDK